jgi:D-sedoheptulose 7-phosphate isomerase
MEEAILDKLMKNHPPLDGLRVDILSAYELIKKCYLHGGKVLVCGNGGSAADAEHIVGELMKGFLLNRKMNKEQQQKFQEIDPDDADYYIKYLQGALPAISLISHSALLTAFINDQDPNMVYAQQVFGYGREGDVLIGISTSGNSKNIIHAIKVGKILGLKTIALTGSRGGAIARLCDVSIKAPSEETYRIQEYHLPIYHALCAMVEQFFFKE